MPIIHIEVAQGSTTEQLHDLMANVSRATADALAVPETRIRVLLQEVDPARWFSGGQTLADKRRSAE